MESDLEPFREWLVEQYRADANYDRVEVLREPETPLGDLCVRLHVANRSYYEVRVLLSAAELQVGFGTEHRMVNEGIEESILESGGDLSELLEDELCELGEEPAPMEHFWERPTFRFTTRLPLPDVAALGEPALRARVLHLLRASRILFQECVDEA